MCQWKHFSSTLKYVSRAACLVLMMVNFSSSLRYVSTEHCWLLHWSWEYWDTAPHQGTSWWSVWRMCSITMWLTDLTYDMLREVLAGATDQQYSRDTPYNSSIHIQHSDKMHRPQPCQMWKYFCWVTLISECVGHNVAVHWNPQTWVQQYWSSPSEGESYRWVINSDKSESSV